MFPLPNKLLNCIYLYNDDYIYIMLFTGYATHPIKSDKNIVIVHTKHILKGINDSKAEY
jgi:hypothetical protein